jgi:ABC-type nitrate/sulfonate/bicarbonate transport system substrate-binding protein
MIGRLICAWLIAFSIPAQAQTAAPTALRVIAFDGGWNIPVWAAQRQGFFEAQGVTVQLSYTPTSVFLITALLDGRFDLALGGMDNVVAYQEGQGGAGLPTTPILLRRRRRLRLGGRARRRARDLKTLSVMR